MQTKRKLKRCTRNVHPSFADFRPGLGVNFHILLTQNWLWKSSLSLLSLLMHTISDKVRFVQRKLKHEEAFTTQKWMVLAEHLLAQAHIHTAIYTTTTSTTSTSYPSPCMAVCTHTHTHTHTRCTNTKHMLSESLSLSAFCYFWEPVKQNNGQYIWPAADFFPGYVLIRHTGKNTKTGN